MEKLAVGTKLYHYIYGAMTIVSKDGEYLQASVDKPTGISKAFREKYPSFSTMSTHKWNAAAVVEWIFTDQKDVIILKDEYRHSDFGGSKQAGKDPVSDVRVKIKAESDIKVRKESDEETGEISDVRIKK
jgi:hypothetical protein